MQSIRSITCSRKPKTCKQTFPARCPGWVPPTCVHCLPQALGTCTQQRALELCNVLKLETVLHDQRVNSRTRQHISDKLCENRVQHCIETQRCHARVTSTVRSDASVVRGLIDHHLNEIRALKRGCTDTKRHALPWR